MNIKVNLTKLYFTVIAIVLVTSTIAQSQLSYDNNSKNFSITTSTIDSQIIQGRTPYAKVLLETGTGAFFIFQTSNRFGQTFSQAWHYKASGTYQPIISTSYFYDTTKPPRDLALNLTPTTSSGSNSIQNLLADEQFIKITNCIGDTIIPNDTMTLAVTYKSSSSSTDACTYTGSVIAFFYNNPDNTNLFSQIPTDNTTYSFNGLAVKPLRKYNGESVVTLGDLPSSIQSILNTSGSGFSKALYMTTPYANDAERNFFLSLIPDSTVANYQSQTGTIKAVLIDYSTSNPGTCNNQSYYSQRFEVSFVSRDPNSISITPDYFPNKSSAANKLVDYKIHFENEGPGRANRILVTASIPKGIQFPLNGEEIFNCKIGDNDVAVINEESPAFTSEKNPRFCIYRLDPLSRKIYFTITNARLSGIVGLKGKNNIGEISFSLKTNSRRNIPKSMISKASIIFDDNKPETSSASIKIN